MSAVEKLLADRPRADAQRNVQRLVEAAREAVVEVGTAVTAHEIARRAGVGIGTFYRRLPSLKALLEAVLADTLAEIVELADDAMRDDDPWRGFSAFAAEYVRLRAASCGINDVLGSDRSLDLSVLLAELRDRLRRIVERAQAAGAMRADVTWQDVAFLLAGILIDGHTIGLTVGDAQWSRSLPVLLDGLRTPAPQRSGRA